MKNEQNATETPLALGNFATLGKIKDSLTEAQISFLKTTLYPTLSPSEIILVCYRAYQLKLDVFSKELIAYKNSKGQIVQILTRDAKLRRAQETGELEQYLTEPIYIREVPTFDMDSKQNGVRKEKCEPWEGTLWGAQAIIQRKDRNPVVVTVELKEYAADNTQWKKMPSTMIQKVAGSQALSREFPELFSGMYDESEMPSGEVIEEVQTIPDEPATTAQIETIQKMGGEVTEELTTLQANAIIKNLSTKHAKSKKSTGTDAGTVQ